MNLTLARTVAILIVVSLVNISFAIGYISGAWIGAAIGLTICVALLALAFIISHHPRVKRWLGRPYYEILGLDYRIATEEDVENAYRKLALRCHNEQQLPSAQTTMFMQEFTQARNHLLNTETFNDTIMSIKQDVNTQVQRVQKKLKTPKTSVRCGQCRAPESMSEVLFQCGHLACLACAQSFREEGKKCDICHEDTGFGHRVEFADKTLSGAICKKCKNNVVAHRINTCGHMVCSECIKEVKLHENCPFGNHPVSGHLIVRYFTEDIVKI